MNVSQKIVGCGTTVLLAAALSLSAQTTQTPSGDTREKDKDLTTTMTKPSSSTQSSAAQFDPSAPSQSVYPSTSSTSATGSTSSSSGVSSAQRSTSTEPSTQSTQPSSTASNRTEATTDTQSTAQSTTQQSATTQTSLAATTQTDTQVTTVVQQIDAQGPVVVERATTQFADVACTADNARKLFDALRNGTAVTLTADVNGEAKTATFTPIGANLGYGEAYLTLALAAEALRAAGVTGCATPEQWQAVLLGGPLTVANLSSTSTTSIASASSSSSFPGILKLRSEGQGWGQIAQTTNVQLGQIVSSARSSFNISESESALTPTGRSSSEFNQPSSSTTPSSTSPSSITDDKDKDKDKDPDKPDDPSSSDPSKSNPADTLNPPRSNR